MATPRFRLQLLHDPRRLDRTINSSGRSVLGTMWSAVVLIVVQPGSRSVQHGSSLMTWSRSLRQALLWIVCATSSVCVQDRCIGRGRHALSPRLHLVVWALRSVCI